MSDCGCSEGKPSLMDRLRARLGRHRNKDCNPCEVTTSCCSPAPTVTHVAPQACGSCGPVSCSNPCDDVCADGKRQGLFSRLRGRFGKKHGDACDTCDSCGTISVAPHGTTYGSTVYGSGSHGSAPIISAPLPGSTLPSVGSPAAPLPPNGQLKEPLQKMPKEEPKRGIEKPKSSTSLEAPSLNPTSIRGLETQSKSPF